MSDFFKNSPLGGDDNESVELSALLDLLKSPDNDEASPATRMNSAPRYDGGSDIKVSSLQDAAVLLQLHMNPNGAGYRRELVKFITNPDNRVFGSCDRYHNFIMDLFRAGDYDIAIDVCDYALKLAPSNRDIIADAIKACGDSCQFDRGEEFLARAEKIRREHWSYRMYLYGVDFLKTKLDAYPDDEEFFHRAEKLALDYTKRFPADEHGYNQLAELYLQMNQFDKARNQLMKAIMNTQPDRGRRDSSLVCAQCCVTLLNILDDTDNYKLIKEICDKGMRSTTQEQPSSKIGFFMYRKALALDGEAHADGFANSDLIKEALACYQAAYDLNQGRSYADTVEERYAILRVAAAKKNVDFVPLKKRPLYVDEMEEK